MVDRYKVISLIEALIIVLLLIFIFYFYQARDSPEKYLYDNNGNVRLLSARVYSNILPPESRILLNFKPVQEDISDYLVRNKLNVSVYVLNLRSESSFGINENEEFEPASLGKLPLAIFVLRNVEAGKMSLNSILPIKPENRDSLSGQLYSKSVDSLSVRDLLFYMLTDSDNTAARVLASNLSSKEWEEISNYIGYYNQDFINSSPNVTQMITAKSTGNIFLSLYLSTMLQPHYSEMILSFLANSTYDIHNYSDIPKNVTIAQKYGEYYSGNEKKFNDCGILYIDQARIFYCVMTSGMDKEDASQVIGKIVNKVYVFVKDNMPKN